MDDDVTLIQSVAAGNADALAALWTRHLHQVRRWIIRLSHQHQLSWDQVEDIAAEVFIRVSTHAATFHPGGNFHGWLWYQTLNRFHDFLDRNALPTIQMPEQPPEPEALPEQNQLMRDELNAQLAGCVEQLPSHLRETVALRYFQGLNAPQIAPLLNIAEGGVNRRLSEARTQLRQCLEGHGILFLED